MRIGRLLAFAALALVGVVALVVIIVVLAHRDIDGIEPELPSPDAVFALPADGPLPTAAFYINTASQPMPRSVVIDSANDHAPDADYVMAHTAFVLRWPDGRIFLVDTGLEPERVETFGALLAPFGADPIVSHGSVAEFLGEAAGNVAGIGFTHVHEDHVSGIESLCEAGASGVIFQTPLQADGGNYTTLLAEGIIDNADCLESERLAAGSVVEVPDFPGLRVVPAAGHTPGSQLFVATLDTLEGLRTLVFTGDTVNHRDAAAYNLPKPWWYSRFIVPENVDQLDRVRRLLGAVAERGATLLVGHDEFSVRASGIPAWPTP